MSSKRMVERLGFKRVWYAKKNKEILVSPAIFKSQGRMEQLGYSYLPETPKAPKVEALIEPEPLTNPELPEEDEAEIPQEMPKRKRTKKVTNGN